MYLYPFHNIFLSNFPFMQLVILLACLLSIFNMNKEIMRKITPLTQNDCFTIFSEVTKEFSSPLHYHEEFELNFIMNAKGAKRIVGDSIEVIDDLELIMIGPNLYH